MIDVRPIGYVIGLILTMLGLTMLLPMTVDLLRDDPNWHAFFKSALASTLIGTLLAIACQSGVGPSFTLRQAFLLTAGIWTITPLFGALPMMIGVPHASLTDAYFEAVSGITTTGSTVFIGLDDMPHGTLLWRGMLNWLGGLGIAFVAMIFLPVMRVGGMQFFRTEGFDTLGKILPRAQDIARSLVLIYAGLTVAFTLCYIALGMDMLEGVVHGMATIATGGFSTSDSSFKSYPPAIEYAGALFMMLSSLPYIRYVQMLNGNPRPLFRDPQARTYVRWYLYAVGIVVVYRLIQNGEPFEPALRQTLFNFASIFSSTGFFTADVAAWGAFAMVVAFVIGVVGGCTSSSAAGLSVFRSMIVLSALKSQIARIHSPHRVMPVRYDHREVDQDTVDAIVMYSTSFILLIGVMSVLITLTGADLTSSVFAVWTSLGNIGYGFGDVVARTGTMIDFTTFAKWVMIVAMLMGRLGLLALIVIVLPRFWRD